VPDGPELPEDIAEGFVAPSGDAFRELVEIMAKLRAPGGCPWDREQTHASLARHLLEETYETLEAIENNDLAALREELGDLVIQIVFHSNIAFEEGAFGVADVLNDLREKLIRRHPHVFGDVEVSGADEVKTNWERIKKDEKERTLFEGIPKALPALARAAKVQKRSASAGFPASDAASIIAKLGEEIDVLRADLRSGDPARLEAELGDVLFMVVLLANNLHVDPEDALRRMLQRYEARVGAVERIAGKAVESLSSDEWARYWEQAKQEHP
jgi:MazG family protein